MVGKVFTERKSTETVNAIVGKLFFLNKNTNCNKWVCNQNPKVLWNLPTLKKQIGPRCFILCFPVNLKEMFISIVH